MAPALLAKICQSAKEKVQEFEIFTLKLLVLLSFLMG